MGLFDNFKKKNYLKRIELINSVDNNKIWSKSMILTEIKELLEFLKNKIDEYEFDFDKNFIMNSRRKTLKSMIEERLSKNDRDINELVSESLFNFFEFVSDEYPGNILSDCRELGISIKEFDAIDNNYRKKGIICIQERDIILEIIQIIKNYINENEMHEEYCGLREDTKMKRDSIKNEDYWFKNLQNNKERMERFSDALIYETNIQRKKTIKSRLEMIRRENIDVMYSAGIDLETCKKEFIDSVVNTYEIWNDSYGYITLLWYVSVAYLLNVDSDIVNKIVSMYKISMIQDSLIETILSKMDNSVMVSDAICCPELERPLLDIIYSREKRNSIYIKDFIEKEWYDLYVDAPWYDSHKRDDNLYKGYWCFEIGAIVKLLSIDDTLLKDIRYYPYDMVNFQKDR